VTNLVDAGGGTTQPHWLGKCAWSHTFDGGYAVRGGSGEGKIYKVEVGSVTTNAINILGDMTVYGSVTAEGGFSGDGSGFTGITASQVGAVATNDAKYLATVTNVTYAAAPACYQITLTNDSALSWTNTWMPTSKVSRVTLTSTGTTTFVWNWPTQQDAGMRFALDMTGMPSVVFPVGAIYLTNGIYGSSAPVLGQSNYVSVTHDCNTYQITVITNTLGTWGTP
jgi:hypothetical protein